MNRTRLALMESTLTTSAMDAGDVSGEFPERSLEHRILVDEVAIQGGARHSGRPSDISDARSMISAFAEESDGTFENRALAER